MSSLSCFVYSKKYYFQFQCSETKAVLVTSDEIMSVANNMQKVNRSNNENCTDKMNIFNVARVKKVELNDLPSMTKVGEDCGESF